MKGIGGADPLGPAPSIPLLAAFLARWLSSALLWIAAVNDLAVLLHLMTVSESVRLAGATSVGVLLAAVGSDLGLAPVRCPAVGLKLSSAGEFVPASSAHRHLGLRSSSGSAADQLIFIDSSIPRTRLHSFGIDLRSTEGKTLDDDLADEGRLAPDNRWRGMVRQFVKNTGPVKSVAPEIGISARTLQSWVGVDETPAVPRLSVLRRVRDVMDYPLHQQLIDLGLAHEGEFQIVARALPASAAFVLGRLDAVLSEITSTRPGVWDLAKAVLDSCAETGHAGRWRATVFDILSGGMYPHVGHRAVEFQRWRGSGTERVVENNPADVQRTERIVRALEPDRSVWSGYEAMWWRHAPNHPRWHLLERVELGQRMSKLRPRMATNSFGGVGLAHTALLHNPNQRYRHIVVDATGARTAHDPSTMRRPSQAFLEGRNKILLVGPPSLSTLPIARMVGSAMGWTVRSERELAGARDGYR